MIALIASLPGTPLYAPLKDDASLGAVGYIVVPLDSDQVVMASESVQAEIRGDQAWVTCIFLFQNIGPATDVLMGFPQATRTPGGSPELLDFRSYVDDEEVPDAFRPDVRREADREFEGWYAFSVPFAAGQTRLVRNTYHGRLTRHSNGERSFGYMLHTGASWHGPIGRGEIVVRWTSDRDVAPDTISASPPPLTTGPHELRWRFLDLEPSLEDDIGVAFRPVYGPQNAGIATASSGVMEPEVTGPGLPAAVFEDSDPSTSWRSFGQTTGAWISWSYAAHPHYATPTYGIAILPGMAGKDFLAHGRPRAVLVRWVRFREGSAASPIVPPVAGSFLDPPPEVVIEEHRFALEDEPRWQILQLDKPITALAFQLVVEGVYPGEQFNDVAIAEIHFPLLEEDRASVPMQRKTGESGSIDLRLLGVLATAATLLGVSVLLWLRRKREPRKLC
jgi:LPXTG-motif cell wall-anchored protein